MNFKLLTLVAATQLLLFSSLQAAEEETADLIFTNAYVYTVDQTRSIAEAVAVRGKKIVFVGSNEGASELIGPTTTVRDLGGAMLMPGIHDMHIHALGTVETESCDLDSQPYTLQELVPVLQSCIEKYQVKPGDWLVVRQWAFSSGNQPDASLPNVRAALDEVSTDRPIFMIGHDGHHSAANSAALALAKNDAGDVIGLNPETLQGEFAKFQPMLGMDEKGQLNGWVSESAQLLLRPSLLADLIGVSDNPEGTMPRVAKRMAQSGITSIQDASVSAKILAHYGWLAKSGLMHFRLRAAFADPLIEDIDRIDKELEVFKQMRLEYEDSELIEANAVKLYADGVLEGNPLTSPPTLPVAAVLGTFKQPIFGQNSETGTIDVTGYVDLKQEVCQSVQADPQAYSDAKSIDAFHKANGYFPQQCIPQSGMLAHSEEFIRAYIRKATDAGFHVHVHALSDKGVRVSVDEFAKVKESAQRMGLTQSLAHVQLVNPEDQKRAGELGVSSAFTFVWTAEGTEYEMMVAPFIDQIDGVADLYNPDHYYMKNVYPARSMMNYGGNVVNGSDAPVGSRDPMPFVSLQQAITRFNGDAVLNENETLSIQEAIAVFTINGAKLFGHQQQVGSIEPGKWADFIVLNQNIVELAEAGHAEQIGKTKVDLTVFNGVIVFERPDF